MEIVPDTKDWTWVLQRPCPECGLDTAQLSREAVPRIIRELGGEWVAVLEQQGDIARRPSPAVWSPLEYACHVRDVFRLFDQRLQRMLGEDNPTFSNWNQDSTAVAERYGEQYPPTVAGELRKAADGLAGRFEQVSGAQWERTGTRSDGAHFTVESFARYLVHDPVHHLHDVGGRRQTASTGAQPA